MTILIFSLVVFCLAIVIVAMCFTDDETDTLARMYRKNGLNKDEAMRAAKSHIEDLKNE